MKFLVIIIVVVLATAGYFFFQNQQLSKPKIENVVPTPTTELLSSGVTNQINYSFTIPPDWKESLKTNNQDRVFDTKLGQVMFWIQRLEPYGTLEEWFKDGPSTAPDYDKKSYTIFTINNHKVLKNYKTGQQTIYGIELDVKNVLMITCACKDQIKFTELFDQILGTFRFLE